MSQWAYGVTTVPSRRLSLLPRTLASLARGGFDAPRLFVDGAGDYGSFKLEVTVRSPAIRTAGNWVLSMVELLMRHPGADRYALFQDDMVCVRNLRAHLDRVPMGLMVYWNLYTFSGNELIVGGRPNGFHEAMVQRGQPAGGLQAGRGAVALVFHQRSLIDLLSHRRLVERPTTPGWWRKIDGGIVSSMNAMGYRELVHNPSLVQHTGDLSSMGNLPHEPARTFPGEDFDALTL